MVRKCTEKFRFMDKRLCEISRFLLRRRACFPSPSARAPASQRTILSKNTSSSVELYYSVKWSSSFCFLRYRVYFSDRKIKSDNVHYASSS